MKYLITAVASIALLFLAGCALTAASAEFTRDRIEDYCTNTTQEARDLLRQQLVYPDGSPMIVVYCAPHGVQ